MSFVIISVSPAFGQESLSGQIITLNTDKTAYNDGDIITLTGSVKKVVAGLDMSIQIFSEVDGKINLVEIAQVVVTEDGQFTKTFVARGSQWQNEGIVTIKATYGQESNELSVKFFKQSGTEFVSSYEVDIPQGGTFDISYTVKGGIITSIDLNENDLSLDIEIVTDSNGSLNIEIPRNSLDSIDENGFDNNFIVLIYNSDDEYPAQADYNELANTDQVRSLYVPLKNGDSKIQIIGTHVVPEFGTIAAIILAVAITSIIVLSAKTKLPIFTKF
jgi:predicted secreted protein with PEFG-CTERM motif